MLHRDTSARFAKTGFWIFAEYHLEAGAVRSKRGWSVARARQVLADQQDTAVALHREETRPRTWWLFRGAIYWEEDDLSATEVKALALEHLTRNDRRLKRALAMMEQAEALTAPGRETIPDDVKVFVWNRDGGRCVRCRSNERLEFDHVIPIALGGANTARNLQLLCQACNREKGVGLA
jgi:hypothetical protein